MKSSKFEYDKWFSKHGLNPNATTKEKDLWWAKERDYWVEGRMVLVGPHYFALTRVGKRRQRFQKKTDLARYRLFNLCRIPRC